MDCAAGFFDREGSKTFIQLWGQGFLWIVKDSIEYKHRKEIFVQGADKDNIFVAQKFNSNDIVLKPDAYFEVVYSYEPIKHDCIVYDCCRYN